MCVSVYAHVCVRVRKTFMRKEKRAKKEKRREIKLEEKSKLFIQTDRQTDKRDNVM